MLLLFANGIEYNMSSIDFKTFKACIEHCVEYDINYKIVRV